MLLIAITATRSAEGIGISSSKCRPVGSKTLIRDAHARVFSLPVRGRDAEEGPESVRVLGCLFGPGRSFLLGTTLPAKAGWPGAGRIDPETIAVATPWTAYSTSAMGVDFNSVRVVVRNLRAGTVSAMANAAPQLGVEAHSTVTDIALAPDGAVAWISHGRSHGTPRLASEVAMSTPSGTTILDEGLGIDLESLQLDGNQLTWLNEGIQRSAEMP